MRDYNHNLIILTVCININTNTNVVQRTVTEWHRNISAMTLFGFASGDQLTRSRSFKYRFKMRKKVYKENIIK